MTTHAYSHIYLSKASRVLGNMLHNAVLEYHYDGEDFLQMFIQSDIAQQFENGNPKYIAGRSGFEVFAEIIEHTTGRQITGNAAEIFDRTDVYWVGWILAHYQWHSGRSFRNILETISYDELLGLYGILHEADVQKSYEVFDLHFGKNECNLKMTRKRCGITQEELSELSGISINTIRAYERRAKDIGKAQVDIVVRLAKALKSEISDILD